MKKEVNPVLKDMIARGQLSGKKIELLIFLHRFIDKVSGSNYISDDELIKLEIKFGVKPDIITWGDYFQTQIAGEHWEKNDSDFEKIIETIHYDIVAAIMICTNKGTSFFQMVEENYIGSLGIEPGKTTENDEVNMHLGVLMNYFRDMKLLISRLDSEDLSFFEQYSLEQAIS